MNNKSAKARSGLLPFPVIAAAMNGNVDAIHSVLKHYEGYIAALSMRKLYDEKAALIGALTRKCAAGLKPSS